MNRFSSVDTSEMGDLTGPLRLVLTAVVVEDANNLTWADGCVKQKVVFHGFRFTPVDAREGTCYIKDEWKN